MGCQKAADEYDLGKADRKATLGGNDFPSKYSPSYQLPAFRRAFFLSAFQFSAFQFFPNPPFSRPPVRPNR